eukprot:6747205-Heterocapsa_arctica.AAC.1
MCPCGQDRQLAWRAEATREAATSPHASDRADGRERPQEHWICLGGFNHAGPKVPSARSSAKSRAHKDRNA